jgi:hypothetical protein
MNTPPSSSPNRPLPQWAYVPGAREEDDADHDTLLQAKTAKAEVAKTELTKAELTKADWLAFFRHRPDMKQSLSWQR